MPKQLFAFLVMLLLAGGMAYYQSTVDITDRLSAKALDTLDIYLPVKQPRVLYGMVIQDHHEVIEDKIRRNQRLGDIFSQYNVPASMIHALSGIPKSIFDPRKITPDRKYTVIVNKDSIARAAAFVYEPNPVEYVVFKFGDTLSVDLFQREIETVEKTVAGVIQSSLSQAIEELGIGPDLTNRFVDIFGWQVDFQRLQKGDKFKLIYSEDVVDGRSIGIRKIEAIYFEHFGNKYYAFPFDQGDGLDYFDEHGKSLRKALLKYPIEFTRISSRYNPRRFHPVQKRWKAHLGTDFAAPAGTPIRSVGDGIVLEATYRGGNGNYVKIKHNSTYTTQYLHMSRIASGVRPGVRVRQGQVIGYVGSTGLATGPHLCYRFWKNGRQVDALRVELPPSAPVKEELMEPFELLRDELTRRLDAITFPAKEQMEQAFASIKGS